MFARAIILLAMSAIVLPALPAEAKGGKGKGKASSSVHTTRSYVKKNGTRVQSYKATNPNKTQRDNFSAKGNFNPYTGKTGTKAVAK
jgi:hypothetical protein